MGNYLRDALKRELLFKEKLLQSRKKANKNMCLCCNDIASPARRFCSKDCQEDYEFHSKKKITNLAKS